MTAEKQIAEENSYMFPHGARPAAIPRATIDPACSTHPAAVKSNAAWAAPRAGRDPAGTPLSVPGTASVPPPPPVCTEDSAPTGTDTTPRGTLDQVATSTAKPTIATTYSTVAAMISWSLNADNAAAPISAPPRTSPSPQDPPLLSGHKADGKPLGAGETQGGGSTE